MLKKLIESLRPADFRSSHALFELPSRGRPSGNATHRVFRPGDRPLRPDPDELQDLYVLQNFGNLAPPPDPQRGDATDVESAVALYQAEGHRRLRPLALRRDENAALLRQVRASQALRISPPPCAEDHADRRRTRRRAQGERLLAEAARVNVLVQLENLRATPSIAARLDGGDLHLHGWLYTGGVITAYDPHRAGFPNRWERIRWRRVCRFRPRSPRTA